MFLWDTKVLIFSQKNIDLVNKSSKKVIDNFRLRSGLPSARLLLARQAAVCPCRRD